MLSNAFVSDVTVKPFGEQKNKKSDLVALHGSLLYIFFLHFDVDKRNKNMIAII